MVMLRGSGADLRGQRASVDTGSGEKRLASGRAEHLGRGQFVNFYEDLGFSATPEKAKELREQEDTFKSDVKKQQGTIDTARGELATARGRLDKAAADLGSGAIDKAWSKAKKGFTPVRIVDPSGHKVEATYYLPKEAIGQIAEQTQGFEQRFVDDGKNYNISVKHESGMIRGQELHDALRGVEGNVYKQFVKEATPGILKGRQELKGYYEDIGVKEAELEGAQTMLSGTKKQRAKMWSDARSDYQKKLKTMENIFNKFNVKKGGE